MDIRFEDAQGEPTFSRTWLLDGGFRVIAEIWGCGGPVVDCDLVQHWSFTPYAGFAPFGIGLPARVQAGDVFDYVGSEARPVDLVVREERNGTLYIQGPIPGKLDASFWYTPGRWLPEGEKLRILEYHNGDALVGAGVLTDLLTDPTPAAWRGHMFAGEGEDHFDVGASHLEIVDETSILTNSGACIVGYSLSLVRSDGAPGLLGALGNVDRRVASADIFGIVSEKIEHWSVHVMSNDFNESTWLEPQLESKGAAAFTCSDAKLSPWPHQTIAEGLAIAGKVVGDDRRPTVIYHGIGALRHFGLSPEDGWTRWSFFYSMDSRDGLGDMHQVSFMPSRSPLLDTVQVGIDDVAWADRWRAATAD